MSWYLAEFTTQLITVNSSLLIVLGRIEMYLCEYILSHASQTKLTLIPNVPIVNENPLFSDYSRHAFLQRNDEKL